MQQGFKDIAKRIVNAEDAFSQIIMDISGCSQNIADKVTSFYLKNKIAKMDAVIGRISVKHGVYLEKDVVMNAVKAVN